MNVKDFKDIENPWANISWENTTAEGDDKEKIEAYKEIDLTLLPEPFTGDLETCEVVCLNLNPGLSNRDNLFKGNPRLLDLTQRTLRHQLGHSMWFDEITDDDGKPHPGCTWWNSRTKSLREKLGGGNGEKRLDGKKLKIFVLEYFPYHTKSSINFPSLPSDEYRNQLLDYAIDKNKLIVIMRGRKRWFEIKGKNNNTLNLGEKLQQYKNKFYLRNVRNCWLSENNLVSPEDSENCWEQLTDKLRV